MAYVHVISQHSELRLKDLENSIMVTVKMQIFCLHLWLMSNGWAYPQETKTVTKFNVTVSTNEPRSSFVS